jgi:hypothetical protein
VLDDFSRYDGCVYPSNNAAETALRGLRSGDTLDEFVP